MDITMPQLGETVTEGTITRWLKAVGESVAVDEPLFDSEVPSPAAVPVCSQRSSCPRATRSRSGRGWPSSTATPRHPRRHQVPRRPPQLPNLRRRRLRRLPRPLHHRLRLLRLPRLLPHRVPAPRPRPPIPAPPTPVPSGASGADSRGHVAGRASSHRRARPSTPATTTRTGEGGRITRSRTLDAAAADREVVRVSPRSRADLQAPRPLRDPHLRRARGRRQAVTSGSRSTTFGGARPST